MLPMNANETTLSHCIASYIVINSLTTVGCIIRIYASYIHRPQKKNTAINRHKSSKNNKTLETLKKKEKTKKIKHQKKHQK